jgi:hypothetical protein
MAEVINACLASSRPFVQSPVVQKKKKSLTLTDENDKINPSTSQTKIIKQKAIGQQKMQSYLGRFSKYSN